MGKVRVLDSSILLAEIFNEPGADRAHLLFSNAYVSSVNLTEVHTILQMRGASEADSWERIQELEYVSVPFDDELARIAGGLIWQTRPFGLSLGDRACLALAIQRSAKVYTTDRAWTALKLGIEIEVIR